MAAGRFSTGDTATPLLQISFFPLLIHVYLKPETVEVVFTFVHLAPVFAAAELKGVRRLVKRKIKPKVRVNFLFIVINLKK